jgi:copper(I)-binding protein
MKPHTLKELTARALTVLRSTRFGLGVLVGGLFMALVFSTTARAHDFRIGAIVIDHPYATPSLASSRSGAVYIKLLRNKGDAPDRLLGAQTQAAARVSLHAMQMDGEVMRMREVPAIELPAQSALRMGHAQASGNTNGYHLMLEGLKATLKDGDRFDLTLRFEKAGERTVQIWVQTPRGTAAHKH